MTKRTRRNHSPAFKAKVALAAVKGEKTLAELARLCCKNPKRIRFAAADMIVEQAWAISNGVIFGVK